MQLLPGIVFALEHTHTQTALSRSEGAGSTGETGAGDDDIEMGEQARVGQARSAATGLSKILQPKSDTIVRGLWRSAGDVIGSGAAPCTHAGLQASATGIVMTPNPVYIQALQQSVRAAPYPHLIGMNLTALEFDRCRVELDLDARHLQPFGIVHGGVLATLIDTATFWAGFLRLPDDCGLVNVDLKLNYLRAVMRGQLRVEGRCLRAGKQISYAEASVLDEGGELLAHGTSTLMALPGKGLKLGIPKFL
jgi:uncharacterized protein (TIGR00369 family)